MRALKTRFKPLLTAALAGAALLAPLGLAPAALAHEFWLEPVNYRLTPGETIRARAINGQNFTGTEYGYRASEYANSGIALGAQRDRLRGDSGAKPAVQVRPLAEGLNVLFHASTASTLTYDDLEKFESFLIGKHIEAALEEHIAEGLPQENIREVYFRFVKAMVAVGNGAGADAPVGMPYEFVSLTNPYTSGGDVRLKLLLRGKSAGADVPVYVFQRLGGTVDKLDLRTDAQGEVAVPRVAGAEYMVNAVHIERPNARLAEASRSHWVTLWAAMTYQVD